MNNNFLVPFYEFARNHPERVASTDSTGEITYGKLFDNGCRFYQSYLSLEFTHKKVVLLFPGGIEAVSSIVSVITAGLCYVILDPTSPSDRNRVICSIGDFDYLITSEVFLPEAEKIFDNSRILIYDRLLKAEPVEFSTIPDVE